MSKSVPERSSETEASEEAISKAAALWVVLSDRGLTATELAEFEKWMAEDARHRRAMAGSTMTWGLLDRVSDSFAKTPEKSREVLRSPRLLLLTMAAAAVVAISIAGWRQLARSKAAVATSAAVPRTLLLSDGTLVSLNSGAEVSENFTTARRRVVLLHGEAHFNVKKNAAWPFAVRAGNTEVVAVGTAFDVDLQASQIEVVVTEGKVRVSSDVSSEEAAFTTPSSDGSMVRAGQQALVNRRHFYSPWRVEVADSDPQNLARILAWKNPLTSLTGATLGELAADFRKRIGYRLDFADPDIASLRIGGRFRVDDVEDFVRLLADNFGLEAKHVGQNETVLRFRK